MNREQSESVFSRNQDSPGIGFSKLINSPAVRQALKKQRRAVGIGGAIIIPMPLIGFVIYGAVSDSMEVGQSFIYGLIVSVIFALTNVIVSVRHKMDQSFVGTVEQKKKVVRVSDSDDRVGKDEWFIYFDCEDGRRRKKEVSRTIYKYLQEGDRVRYLPQFPQPYEKYNKTQDNSILCMFCSRSVSIENDQCPYCKNPLINLNSRV